MLAYLTIQLLEQSLTKSLTAPVKNRTDGVLCNAVIRKPKYADRTFGLLSGRPSTEVGVEGLTPNEYLPEKAVLTKIQTGIERDVFGMLANEVRELTYKGVRQALYEVKTIYYFISELLPKTDAEGKPAGFQVMATGEFLIHPENLPAFIKGANEAGFTTRDIKTLSREEQIQLKQ